MNKQKCFVLLSSIFLLFVLSACSGKVQTNKIPAHTKYVLPKKNSNDLKEQALDTKELQTFSIALEEFFKTKTAKDEEEQEVTDIYQIGIDRGYF